MWRNRPVLTARQTKEGRSRHPTAKRLRPKAQGCRALAATLGKNIPSNQTQRGCANKLRCTNHAFRKRPQPLRGWKTTSTIPRVAAKAREPCAVGATASRLIHFHDLLAKILTGKQSDKSLRSILKTFNNGLGMLQLTTCEPLGQLSDSFGKS